MATGNFRKVFDLGTSQVALLHNRPIKDKDKFFTSRMTTDGHKWVRFGKVLLTDCTCFDLETGEKRVHS